MATADAARPTAGVKRRAAPRDDDDQDLDLELDPEREEQFDLLTAAVIGMAVGAGIALLVRRGPSGVRPVRQHSKSRDAVHAGQASADSAVRVWPELLRLLRRYGPGGALDAAPRGHGIAETSRWSGCPPSKM